MEIENKPAWRAQAKFYNGKENEIELATDQEKHEQAEKLALLSQLDTILGQQHSQYWYHHHESQRDDEEMALHHFDCLLRVIAKKRLPGGYDPYIRGQCTAALSLVCDKKLSRDARLLGVIYALVHDPINAEEFEPDLRLLADALSQERRLPVGTDTIQDWFGELVAAGYLAKLDAC